MGSFKELAAGYIEHSALPQQNLTGVLSDYGPVIESELYGNYFRMRFVNEPNENTETIIFDTNPYSVDLNDPSLLLRRKVAAEVLGPRFSVVGVEVCNPKMLPLSANQRHEVASGQFDVFTDRLLAAQAWVARSYGTNFKQAFYGFSMGGDVSAEAGLRSVANSHRGEVGLDYVGVFDPARTRWRGRIAMSHDFANSVPDLYEEIAATNLPSLYESRGIDPNHPRAKQKHLQNINVKVARSIARHPLQSLAMQGGFGQYTTTESLKRLVDSAARPLITVGRMGLSTICDQDLIETLKKSHNVDALDKDKQTIGYHNTVQGYGEIKDIDTWLKIAKVIEFEGYTHAAADNLAKNAGFMLRTVMR